MRYRQNWKPGWLLQLSGAVHLSAVVLAIARPDLWLWALIAVIGNHLLLALTGLWPKSTWLGPNLTQLPKASIARGEVAISIDDGPDPEVTPRVLALLTEYGVHATFFCIGERVSQHPELARQIVRAGHAIENHTNRHRFYFSLLGLRRLREEIEQAQQAIVAATGHEPHLFRAPAGLRGPLLDPVLSRLGLHLVSWTRRGFDTVNADPDSVCTRLTHRLRSGDILLLHDGHAARTRSGSPVILEVLPRLLAALAVAGLRPVTLRAALQ